MMVLKIRAVYRAIFENRMVKSFLRAVPGMDEWSMLGKAWFHTTEQVGGRPRWDLVILDAPATGHGLDLLRVPQVLLDVAPPSPLRREAEKCWNLMHDAARSGCSSRFPRTCRSPRPSSCTASSPTSCAARSSGSSRTPWCPRSSAPPSPS
jgi:hypothetical protein